MGGVQLLYTKWVTHSFSMVGCKIFKYFNFSLSTANHSMVSFRTLYKTLLPQQVIKISHAHDENALLLMLINGFWNKYCCLVASSVHRQSLSIPPDLVSKRFDLLIDTDLLYCTANLDVRHHCVPPDQISGTKVQFRY